MTSIEEEKNWQSYVREMKRKPGSVYYQMCQLLRYKQVYYKNRPIDKWEFYYCFKSPVEAAKILLKGELPNYYVQPKKRPYELASQN